MMELISLRSLAVNVVVLEPLSSRHRVQKKAFYPPQINQSECVVVEEQQHIEEREC